MEALVDLVHQAPTGNALTRRLRLLSYRSLQELAFASPNRFATAAVCWQGRRGYDQFASTVDSRTQGIHVPGGSLYG